jgi:multiple sugar transport system permease protein
LPAAAESAAAPRRAPAERRPSRLQRVFGDTPTAWVWVTPAVVIILGLSLVPMAWALLLSFQKSDFVTPSTWVGVDNYRRLLDDATFRHAVEHTLLYTAAFVPLSIAGGLGIALLLNRRIRFIGFYRTLVIVPYIMSATAQGVLFSFVFDSQFGVANALLDKVGIARQGFLQDPGQALWVLVLIGLWSGIGFCVVIYLAALQDIPRELVEAASIDGARRRGIFLHVVLPALRPVTVFLFVWQTFESLQLFDLVFVTTRGGPLQSTTVVVLYVWQQAFEFFNAGYGAAAAYVLAFGLLVVALVWGAYARRREARLT